MSQCMCVCVWKSEKLSLNIPVGLDDHYRRCLTNRREKNPYPKRKPNINSSSMHSLTTAQCFISIFCAKFLILHINTPKVLQNIFFACNHNRNICTRTPLETRTIKCIQQWFRIILVLMPNFRFGLSFSFPFHASYF